METNRVASVIGANGVALAFSFATSLGQIVAVLQAVALITAIVFTCYQIIRSRKRLKAENTLSDIALQAERACPIAVSDECPVRKRLVDLRRESL